MTWATLKPSSRSGFCGSEECKVWGAPASHPSPLTHSALYSSQLEVSRGLFPPASPRPRFHSVQSKFIYHFFHVFEAFYIIPYSHMFAQFVYIWQFILHMQIALRSELFSGAKPQSLPPFSSLSSLLPASLNAISSPSEDMFQ